MQRSEGITRLRPALEMGPTQSAGARPARYSACMPTYHPSYLLRTPARKGEAWRDLLSAQSKLEASE